MKNKTFLPLLVFALALGVPAKAEAGFIGELVAALFGVNLDTPAAAEAVQRVRQNPAPRGAPKPVYYTFSQSGGQYQLNPIPRSQRLTNPHMENVAYFARNLPGGPLNQQDARAGCSYVGRCRQCPGPPHPVAWQSTEGRWIRVNNGASQARLHPSIRRVLGVMADQRGLPVTVTSGFRSCKHNNKVGGVSKSQHLLGNAADFRFTGSGEGFSTLANAARRALNSAGMSGYGGTGTYCTPAAHVDTGTRRQWNWGCRGAK